MPERLVQTVEASRNPEQENASFTNVYSEKLSTKTSPMVSFIIPAFNEGDQLALNIYNLIQQYSDLAFSASAEFLLATDSVNASTFNSMDWLNHNGLCKSYFLTERIGKGGTIKNLVQISKGKVIVILDADVPVSADKIHNAIMKVAEEKADIVIAQRKERSDGELRKFLSVSYNLLVRILFNSNFRDHQAGFKVINAKAFSQALKFIRTDSLAFDTELLVWAKKSGLKILAADVNWEENRKGHVSNIVPARSVLTMLIDLFVLRVLSINGNSDRMLQRIPVGNILDARGKEVSAEYMTVLTSKHKKLGLFRRLYLALAFRA